VETCAKFKLVMEIGRTDTPIPSLFVTPPQVSARPRPMASTKAQARPTKAK
jgi:hypothetical protein